MRGIIMDHYNHMSRDLPSRRRLSEKTMQEIWHGKKRHLRWKFDSRDIGDLLIRYQAIFLDYYEKKVEDNYNFFVSCGKLDINFTIEELENMRVGKDPDDFSYWHTCHMVKPNTILPHGCIHREFSTQNFCLLFTDGTFFVVGTADKEGRGDYYLNFVEWWRKGIIEWRELSKAFQSQQCKVASLPDNNADSAGNNGSLVAQSGIEVL
jgi:hypothetical protein